MLLFGATLQGVLACAGAASSIVINKIIGSTTIKDPKTGEIGEMTLAEKQERENLANTILTGAVEALGGDAATASAAAKIEMENNQLSPAAMTPVNPEVIAGAGFYGIYPQKEGKSAAEVSEALNEYMRGSLPEGMQPAAAIVGALDAVLDFTLVGDAKDFYQAQGLLDKSIVVVLALGGPAADGAEAALKAAKKALDAGDVKKAEGLINEAKDIIKADASQAGKVTGTTTSKSPTGGSQTGGTIAGSQKDIVQHTAPPGVNQPAIKQETKFPTNTDKTGDLGAKPTGERTVAKHAADSETKRGLGRENESADLLADAGYNVHQNPKVTGDKNPDYLIEGRIFDNYAPISGLQEIILIDKNKNIIRFYP